MEEVKYKNLIIPRVEIHFMPDEISLEGVLPSKCTNNSKLVVENNTLLDIKYVEGIIMIYLDDSNYYAELHAWNIFDGNHFDSTLENLDLYLKSKNLEHLILKREYFPFQEINVEALITETNKAGDEIVKFAESSTEFMKEMLLRFPKQSPH